MPVSSALTASTASSDGSSRRVPGRTTDSQITVADLTGVGFQDTAIASTAINATLQAGR